MRSILKSLPSAFLIVIFTASFAGAANAITFIGKDQLKQELQNPDVVVIDVRVPHEWDSSQSKIQGARRESPDEVNEWMTKYPKDKTLVLYCD